MSQALGWVYLLSGVLGLIDGLRFSYREWESVGRSKNFWLPMLFFFGPLFLPLYLLLVRPVLRTAHIVKAKPRTTAASITPPADDAPQAPRSAARGDQ